jgi:hypothetical protein
MVRILLAILLLCYVLLPVIFLLYFWRSKYCSCPYCGNKILKTDKNCTHCSEKMPKYGTVEKKVIKVGKAYQEGAKILSTPENKIPDRLEKKE